MSARTTTSFRPAEFSVEPLTLRGLRCGGCGQVSFPTRESCPACGAPDALAEQELSTQGKLCSWSVVRNAPAGLLTPYTLAYVDLPEGVRVMSRLCGVEDVELAVGLPLELTSLPVRSTRAGDALPAEDVDVDVHMFAFRPMLKETS